MATATTINIFELPTKLSDTGRVVVDEDKLTQDEMSAWLSALGGSFVVVAWVVSFRALGRWFHQPGAKIIGYGGMNGPLKGQSLEDAIQDAPIYARDQGGKVFCYPASEAAPLKRAMDEAKAAAEVKYAGTVAR